MRRKWLKFHLYNMKEPVKKIWRTVEINVAGQAPGRVATQIAKTLMGKHRADYAPQEIGGDSVKVTHVRELKIAKRQLESKLYKRHSGYPGGLHESLMKDVWAKNPAEIIKKAVKRMLPVNRLRDVRMKRLTIE